MAAEGETSSDSDGVSSSKFRQMIGNKDVHFLSFFALIYVGVEVTMGGWCYLKRQTRNLLGLTGIHTRLERNIHPGATPWQFQRRIHIFWVLWR